MSGQSDWLAGGDRTALAVARIHAAAAELIARDGMDRLSIDHVAALAGCSRATVYRHVGGKAALRDAVLAAATTRIAHTIGRSVATRTGTDRVAEAILTALAAVRADPVAAAFLRAADPSDVDRFLASNPRLAEAAAALSGVAADDLDAGRWIVRVVLSLLFWPGPAAATERALVERFVVPIFAA